MIFLPFKIPFKSASKSSQFKSHRLEPTKTFIFSKNHHFGYHQNHLKIFGCLDSCFCVFMWIIIEIFTKRSRSPGSSDMEKSLGPELLRPFLGAGKMVKLRQIRQHPEIAAEKLFFFDLFSMCFRFFLFFSIVFVVFVFDSCRFFSFLNQI